MPLAIPWRELTAQMQEDSAGRGLTSSSPVRACLDPAALERAATGLAKPGANVGIVTGFNVQAPHDRHLDGLAAETDGPPGALYLARAIVACGGRVLLISDRHGMPLLEAGCDYLKLREARRQTIDLQPAAAERQLRSLLENVGSELTHLIAIERAGPSHTLASLAAQPRKSVCPIQQFEAEVLDDSRDKCYDRAGNPIDSRMAPLYRLFELVGERQLPVETIGIGDGGNEIGMGAIPWEVLRASLPPGRAHTACRISTDTLIVAGVSDWGAYALAIAFAVLHGRNDLLVEWDADLQAGLLYALVQAGAVDGITKQRQPTVDGLPLESYLSPLKSMLRLFRG